MAQEYCFLVWKCAYAVRPGTNFLVPCLRLHTLPAPTPFELGTSSLMMQESCNQGGEGASVSAADIIAVGSNGNVVSPGKVLIESTDKY